LTFSPQAWFTTSGTFHGTSNDQILHRGELEHVQMQLHLGFYKRKETESWRALGTFFPIFGDIFFGKNLCGDIFQKHHK
jgi:hypothetical protein